MSLQSATDKIKALNPNNISGVVKQSLDLVKTLDQVQGNPAMIMAVGQMNLMGAMQGIISKFMSIAMKNGDINAMIKGLVELARMQNIAGKSVIMPDIDNQVNTILKQLQSRGRVVDFHNILSQLETKTINEVLTNLGVGA